MTSRLNRHILFLLPLVLAVSTLIPSYVLPSAHAAAFDYSLSNSGPVSITQGSSATLTITAKLTSGNATAVTLSCVAPLPIGVSCLFATNPVIPNSTGVKSILTLSTTSSTTGPFNLAVTGSPLGATTTSTMISVTITTTGLVCVTTSTTPTTCPASPPTIGPLSPGSTFTVGVYVSSSDAMGGYDIYVAANPSYLTPLSLSLGPLIASPSLTSICVNGSAQNGTCTVGTANGPGAIEASTIESSGSNECAGLTPCSGLAFTITYIATASVPSTPLFFPAAPGCSTSSVSSPANTCVLVDTAVGTTIPETVQGAAVTMGSIVCITSPQTANACAIGTPNVPVTLGSTFTVGVRVENSQPLAGFDIYVAVDPNYLNPTNVALGTLIASPSLTTRCLNGQSIEGACTTGTANGPGVVEVSTVEGSGSNECATAPCTGLAFNITYQVLAATPTTPFSYPTAPGCSVSSVASPLNTCVLILNATGTPLPENIHSAMVTQSITLGHSTTLVPTCISPIVVGLPTTCTATVTDTAAGATSPIGTVAWSTDASGSYTPIVCTLSATGPNTSRCSVFYEPTLVGTGGAGGNGVAHLGATYSGDTTHSGSSGQFTLTVLRSTPLFAAFVIIDQTGLPVPSAGVPLGVKFHAAVFMLGGYPVTGAPGTVTYTLFPNSACTTGTGSLISTVIVGPSDNVPNSASISPAVGGYSINAFYQADSNNFNVTSACIGFTVTAAPSLTRAHWTHHLSLSKTGNAQSWTITVSNPLSTSAKVVVRIVGSSTINPSLTFDVICGTTCINTFINVNLTPGLTPVTINAGASTAFSFSQPISTSFSGQKVTFTVTLYWTTGTLYQVDGSTSGSFSVTP